MCECACVQCVWHATLLLLLLLYAVTESKAAGCLLPVLLPVSATCWRPFPCAKRGGLRVQQFAAMHRAMCFCRPSVVGCVVCCKSRFPLQHSHPFQNPFVSVCVSLLFVHKEASSRECFVLRSSFLVPWWCLRMEVPHPQQHCPTLSTQLRSGPCFCGLCE